MVYSLLHADQKADRQFSDEQITDILISLVFTGHEAVSATATLALKYLDDHPRVLREIRESYLS